MSTNNYEKVKKKVQDFYTHYQYLLSEINKTNLNKKIFKSFISNSMLLKICELDKNDYKSYLKKLRNNKIFDNLQTDTIPRKIKKIVVKISPRFYYRNNV